MIMGIYITILLSSDERWRVYLMCVVYIYMFLCVLFVSHLKFILIYEFMIICLVIDW